MNDRCPRCGALTLSGETTCPRCGAALPAEEAPIPVEEIPGAVPDTIEALRAYCDRHRMPLEIMRFFIGQNCPEPRAFGVYRDGGDVIVYKNKSDGSRAVRYQGPDEAHAVRQLYDKLLDECHRRDIWPDGRPAAPARKQGRSVKLIMLIAIIAIVLAVGIAFFTFRIDSRQHAHDGYYNFDEEGLYYRYGDNWYYGSDDIDWIHLGDGEYSADYDDYYIGDDYDPDWGYTDFETSDTWEDLHEDRDSGSSDDDTDFDDWDAGDTDWDSDW